MNKEIYLDNAATTKIDDRVLNEIVECYKIKYGNASSVHDAGVEAKKILERSREIIADSINASPEEIIFTSGGTESNNFALEGVAMADKSKNEIITTKIEHPSVINALQFLESFGYKIISLDVDSYGFVNLEKLKNSINKNTLLVSVIHANNEIGTIQNISEIGKICREKNVLFHTDACQSYMKTKIDVKNMNIDLMTLNAHKIHGPKGVGALFVRKGIKINPLISGGGQEKNKRGGTENIPGIAGFARAVEIYNKEDIQKMRKLKAKIISEILEITGTNLNGPAGDNSLPNIININFDKIEGESILGLLSEEKIYVSTGSACSSKSLRPSHVLLAIGLKPENAHGSIRISLSKFTTEKEVDEFLKIIPKVVERLRKISPFWKEEQWITAKK